MVLTTLSAYSFAALIGIIGLMVGSFLNVVIYRLPIMMHKNWRKECENYLELQESITTDTSTNETSFNLILPLSHCPHCNVGIKPYQNIPVISYLFLKGRCGHCHTPISLRYPSIELLTAILSVAVAWHFGCTLQTLFALSLTWCLIALSFIDIDQQLLPDSITLPLLWLGLLLNVFHIFADAEHSIIGAIAGYLILWSVYHLFKLITGKEGMGYGDFKLLAVFGAWLGWQYLPLIILLSSLVGAIIGSSLIIFTHRNRHTPIPFGPYLATAGWIALLWGKQINQLYLGVVGF